MLRIMNNMPSKDKFFGSGEGGASQSILMIYIHTFDSLSFHMYSPIIDKDDFVKSIVIMTERNCRYILD
jgi:hypothetical protein